MKDNFDDIFGSDITNDVEAQPETETVEDNQAETVEETEEAVPEAATAVAETEDDDLDEVAKRVPLVALTETCQRYQEEKRQRLERERELEDLKAQIAAQQTPASRPDPLDDPDGYHRALEAQFEARLINERLTTSYIVASQQHGQDVVNAARDWAVERGKTDKAFEQSALSQAHPLDWIVQQHKRHSLISEFEADPQGYVLREAQRLGMIKAAEASATVATQPATVEEKNKAPRSLASATSAVKVTAPIDSAEDFNSIFDHKK